MFQKPISKLQEIFAREYERLILWLPVLLGLGCYFSISNFASLNFTKLIFSFILFIFSIVGYFSNRSFYKSFIYAACAVFLFGFIFAFIYQKCRNNYTQITGRVFVDVRGEVVDINKFQNKINGREGFNLALSNLTFYKSEFKKKEGKREPKITQDYIIKNFMNLRGWQEIDREFLDKSKNYQEVSWIKKDGREAYPKPPYKISVIAHKIPSYLKIGDEIFFKASISPAKKKEFVGDFDFAFDAMAKGVGGYGMASGEIIILHSEKNSSWQNFVTNLRKKIQEKILYVLPNEEGRIAAALLMGNQNLISKSAMTEIRNSGLAHLISISGLHMSLAAGIFFFAIRFLLSQSEFLTLRFDIKKIAALAAIISSYFYLEIAGSPVPAQRSFIAVLLVMLAILFDRKVDALRSVCFAAFALILFNPYNIFSISFQLSFAAILVLTTINEIYRNRLQSFTGAEVSRVRKIFSYFFETILISCAIQIAATPLLIYYFGDVAIYGALSNLIAIPLTSFTTMPLGFASFFFMPFGLEKIVLIPMGSTISWVIDISHFVSNLENSHFYLPQMPKSALIFAIFGGLIFCLTKNLKWFGILIFVLSFIPLFFTKQPDLLIDGEGKFFAIYDKNDGLIFSKNLRESKKRELWMRKMNETDFKSFYTQSQDWINSKDFNCGEDLCELTHKNKKILAIYKRSENEKICKEHFDLIINLTRKYALPTCSKKNNLAFDNLDLLNKGVHFIYFQDNKIDIKTAIP